MSSSLTSFLLFLLTIFTSTASNIIICCGREIQVVEMAREEMLHAISNWKWAAIHRAGTKTFDHGSGRDSIVSLDHGVLGDCLKMYQDAESRLARLVSHERADNNTYNYRHDFDYDDGLTWLSAALASHNSCLDGLKEEDLLLEARRAQNLTSLIKEGLAIYNRAKGGQTRKRKVVKRSRPVSNQEGGLLTSWNAATSKADFTVAQDGFGDYKTINDAIVALARLGDNRPERAIIYVKSGVYNEQVEIGRNLRNVMFVGDGIDKTIVTGYRNVQDGATTLNSATFGVSGDGFWARDMTFENTAGPHKHQAVAMRASSDLSVFYQCSFKGYQDTLLVHSLRQFYRDCQIYGTVDFIFGDAAVVFQNCDIFIRRPMDHQSNMITAQGRDDPNANTGISITNSRVVPAFEFSDVKGMFKNYLGRPWKKYSRAVFLKTDLDGMIDGKGWTEWSEDFALSTLYYAEYMNTGVGASTVGRVKWPGFHALSDPLEATPFTIKYFIGGDSWIPATGVPYWSEL